MFESNLPPGNGIIMDGSGLHDFELNDLSNPPRDPESLIPQPRERSWFLRYRIYVLIPIFATFLEYQLIF